MKGTSEGENCYIVVQPIDRKTNLIEKAFEEGIKGGLRIGEDIEWYRKWEEEDRARRTWWQPWRWFWAFIGKFWLRRRVKFNFTPEFSKGGEVGECRVWATIYHTKPSGERKYVGSHKLVVDFSVAELRLRPEDFLEAEGSVYIKEERVFLEDFLVAVERILTCSSLKPNDPRVRFLGRVKSLEIKTRGEKGEKYLVPSSERPRNGKA